MNVKYSVLESSGSSSNTDIYTTGSYTPTAGRFVIACIYGNNNDSPGEDSNVPVLTGNNITWSHAVSQTGRSDGTARVSMFVGMSRAPTTGALSINFLSEPQNDCGWIIVEFDGLSINPSAVTSTIIQGAGANSNAATGLTVTLGAFQKPSNPTFGFIMCDGSAGVTPGSGFTEVSEHLSAHTNQVQYKDSSDMSVDWTCANTSILIAVAVELKRATGGRIFNFL